MEKNSKIYTDYSVRYKKQGTLVSLSDDESYVYCDNYKVFLKHCSLYSLDIMCIWSGNAWIYNPRCDKVSIYEPITQQEFDDALRRYHSVEIT